MYSKYEMKFINFRNILFILRKLELKFIKIFKVKKKYIECDIF